MKDAPNLPRTITNRHGQKVRLTPWRPPATDKEFLPLRLTGRKYSFDSDRTKCRVTSQGETILAVEEFDDEADAWVDVRSRVSDEDIREAQDEKAEWNARF